MTTDLGIALLAHVADLFSPLTSVRTREDAARLLRSVGWDLEALGLDPQPTIDAADALRQAVDRMRTVATSRDVDALEVADALAKTLGAGQALVNRANERASGATIDGAAAQQLGGDLVMGCIDAYLAANAPNGYAVLKFLGVVETVPGAAVSRADGAVVRHALDRLVVNLRQLENVVVDPLGELARRFLYDDAGHKLAADAAADRLGPAVAELARGLGAVASYGVAGSALSLGLSSDELTSVARLLVVQYEQQLADRVTASLIAAAALTDDGELTGNGLAILLVAAGALDVNTPPLTVHAAATPIPLLLTSAGARPAAGGTPRLLFRVAYDGQDHPWARFGAEHGTALRIGGASARLMAEYADGTVDLAVEVVLSDVELAVRGGGDGFLDQVLAGADLRGAGDVGLRWSARHGLSGTGTAAIDLEFPVMRVIGPVTVRTLTVRADLGASGMTGSAALALDGSFGPFAASVSGIGLRTCIAPELSGGQLGELVSIGWQPPNGVGLAIDLPAVRGAGYLELNAEAGRYFGYFELTLLDLVSVKALALVTTRPDVALLIVITVEGFTPIPLGFGFTLTGVGGLLALNRTVAIDRVREGLRSGVVETVLLADNPLINAPRILGALDEIFPYASERLVVGPLGQISWGPLVKIRLAVLLELPWPVRVTVLAALAVTLPNEDRALVELHVDMVGQLDLARGELSLDASLHDSRLLSLTLAGDLSLRLNWGDDPGFTLSIGGFHPRYRQITRSRPLERVSISLTGTKNPSVRLEAYLAITSNSIQFGARASVYAELLGFGIEGGGGFDALVQWSPFAFDVSAEVWVRVFTPFGTLLGIRLALEVSGPAPWHIAGTAELTIFIFTVTVGIDFTSGESEPPPLPQAVDLINALWDAVKDLDAWTMSLPAGVAAAAPPNPRDANGDRVLLVNPLATLTLGQRIVPLGVRVTRVGARVPLAGPRSYDVEIEVTKNVRVVPHRDLFARAQFEDILDDEKLRLPAFEPLKAGYDLLPQQASFVTDDVATTTVTAEIKTLGCDGQSVMGVPDGFIESSTWSPGWRPLPGGMATFRARGEVIG